MQNIIIAAFSALLGFIICYLLFRKNEKQNMLYMLLNDFKNTIEDYKKQNEINTKEVKDAVKSASDLTKILTTNQNLKGQFGEDCLENVLRAIYPNEKIDYVKQVEFKNEDNEKIKPDYLINLPNDNSILIDCKLNLEKYIEYKENINSSFETVKKADFIRDLNSTINRLSNKKYETALISQPDFILMYIPLEPVLTLIYTDNDFLSVVKNANEKNIIIVGTSSVLTVLRLTKLLWAKNVQDKNMQNIINLAQDIYNTVAQHSQNLYNIKNALEENLKSFNKEYEKMTVSKGFFKTVEQLKDFGIQSTLKKSGKKQIETVINSEFL